MLSHLPAPASLGLVGRNVWAAETILVVRKIRAGAEAPFCLALNSHLLYGR